MIAATPKLSGADLAALADRVAKRTAERIRAAGTPSPAAASLSSELARNAAASARRSPNPATNPGR